MALSALFRPAGFGDLAGWRDDDHLAAFEAFRRSAVQASVKPYRTGGLGVEAAAFCDAFEEARRAPPADAPAATRFFERHFAPALITPEASPLPTLDSTRLLARAAVAVALGGRVPGWRGGPMPLSP